MGTYEVEILCDTALVTYLVVANNKDEAKTLAIEEAKMDYKIIKVRKIRELRKPRVLALWDYKARWAIDEVVG